jgi:response regulator of citrate/malate metabolism
MPQAKRIDRIGSKTRALLLAFFEANKHEDLSAEDAAAKFGLSEITCRQYLGAMVTKGLIERVSVYRAKAK